MTRCPTMLALPALLALMPGLASAQTAPVDPVRQEIAELKRRLADLEARLPPEPAAAPAPATPAPAPSAAVASAPVAPAPAAAPHLASASASEQDVAALKGRAPHNVIAGPLDTPVQSPNNHIAFQFNAGTTASSAQLLLSTQVSSTASDHGHGTIGHFQTLSLALSSPLNGNDSATLGTLDGLANGFKVGLSFTDFITRLHKLSVVDKDALLLRARRTCAAKNPGKPEACKDGGDEPAFISEQLGADAVHDFIRGIAPITSMAWGLTASVGYKKYDFLDPASGAPGKGQTHFPVGAKLFAAAYPAGQTTALVGSFEYQHKFTEGDTGTLCPGGTGPQQCQTGAIGAPKASDSYLFSAGIRARYDLGEHALIPAIALSPSVTYDAHSHDVGLDLPVYLVPDSDGNLTGGLRFGWTSDKNKFVAGIFVGSKFGLNQ
ncbi:MAG: hypothetical protein JSS36_03235 [Proteobacteria bacterium]|nr:hypothetical protein [Pseudomonadota bacterium]